MQTFKCSTELALYILPSVADIFFTIASSSSNLSANLLFFCFNCFTVSIRDSTFFTRGLFLPVLFWSSLAGTRVLFICPGYIITALPSNIQYYKSWKCRVLNMYINYPPKTKMQEGNVLQVCASVHRGTACLIQGHTGSREGIHGWKGDTTLHVWFASEWYGCPFVYKRFFWLSCRNTNIALLTILTHYFFWILANCISQI